VADDLVRHAWHDGHHTRRTRQTRAIFCDLRSRSSVGGPGQRPPR
jgi:hypothetical protein